MLIKILYDSRNMSEVAICELAGMGAAPDSSQGEFVGKNHILKTGVINE